MRALIFLFFLLCTLNTQADTMDHYMNISNSIPQMEMKADPQAQAWARSARNVLIITNESIAETLLQANELAKSQGKPLFCLPQGTNLNAIILNGIILETYRDISSQQSDKDKMTVSQVAWLGVTKKYPCQPDTHGKQMEHMAALLAH
ncbi:phosphatase [Legionella cardiaca]|uniref:Phosphatase n=1 Tax=Legionella cardiaca TaxID=1071983 RepID=A0ABY8ARP5_9GAMM|nr:phosphatase [Legionella cardiaca]WED43335.1 phosphatase [Legionella cardiaca]